MCVQSLFIIVRCARSKLRPPLCWLSRGALFHARRIGVGVATVRWHMSKARHYECGVVRGYSHPCGGTLPTLTHPALTPFRV